MNDRLVTPGSEIAPDTHVGVAFEQVPPGVHATPSGARPEALVEGNRVATADQLDAD